MGPLGHYERHDVLTDSLAGFSAGIFVMDARHTIVISAFLFCQAIQSYGPD